MVADDIIHQSIRWQIHWKNGQWRHVSVKEHDVLFRLNSILETIRTCQVEGLILVGDLMEWVELFVESISGVHGVLVGYGRRP